MRTIELVCEYCQKKYKVEVTRWCSRDCYKKAQKGSGNVNYKRGYFISPSGYIVELIHNHPLADKRGRVYKHRRIMYEHLGYLDKKTHIHHIDKNKLNNNISNLRIVTNSEHISFHNPRKKQLVKELQAN